MLNLFSYLAILILTLSWLRMHPLSNQFFRITSKDIYNWPLWRRLVYQWNYTVINCPVTPELIGKHSHHHRWSVTVRWINKWIAVSLFSIESEIKCKAKKTQCIHYFAYQICESFDVISAKRPLEWIWPKAHLIQKLEPCRTWFYELIIHGIALLSN